MTEPRHKMPAYVTCKHSLSLLQEYLEGTLSPEDKADLDRHFKACPPCIDFVKKYQATPKICQKALAEEMPEDVGARLGQFLREKCKKHD